MYAIFLEPTTLYFLTFNLRRDHRGRHAFCAAADLGNPAVLRLLLDAGDSGLPTALSVADLFGRSALYAAAERGREEIVQMLLEARGDVKDAPRWDWWVGWVCGINDDEIDVKRRSLYIIDTFPWFANHVLVVRQDVDRNQRSALHAAASSGSTSTLRRLLDAGAAPNGQDRDGSTALHVAAEKGEDQVTKRVSHFMPQVVPSNFPIHVLRVTEK